MKAMPTWTTKVINFAKNVESFRASNNLSLSDGFSQAMYEIDGPWDLLENPIVEAVFNSVYFNNNPIEPEYRLAYRFGAMPNGELSTNWANDTMEAGLSVAGFIEDGETAYEHKTDEKLIVGGWYFGSRGSDGEPLLLFPEVIK